MAVEPILSTRPQQAFILTIVIQAIIVLVLISVTFRLVGENVDLTDNRYKTLPCYLALFIYAELFELFMAFDALRLRSVIQLFGLAIFHLGMIVFAAIEVHELKAALVKNPGLYSTVKPLVITAPCVIAASLISLGWWVYKLYWEFGWAVFRVVGANPYMKTMYRFYQILLCLLKFDFFAFTSVTMMLLIIVLNTDSAEFGLTIAAIPVVIVLLVLCAIAVQREIRWIMVVSLILMLAAETYFVFKLVRYYSPSTSGQYLSTRATITTFTIIAFLLLLVSFGIGLRCLADFDKGLKEAKTTDAPLFRRGNSSTLGGSRESKHLANEPLEERMSIE
ncbi:unnamed protein product [Peniophora sp. CBMAI 1063]|nr:unnamed protein product [Peniophora sp. CBMAI 1063]